ncbi:peptidase family m13 domain-containing protein [Ditylenchus destructor]|uniref:Peptidase family m13 domain-containing protein n=1 Tax=Ditylenchus destructor TaxID=166010 RepID=A0AAD4QSK6_9BILA|nr:peptidase family m13 domain-containing protein [Ditylenchus destructor]
MFFISRVFSLECEKTTPQSLISQVLTDSHTPSESRTNMMASNMPEFATAFNCPLGSPMNPVKKCVVW